MLGHSWRKWCRFEAVGHEYTNPMAILFRMFLVTNMWNHHNICSRPWFCKCRLSNLNIKFLNPFFDIFGAFTCIHWRSSPIFPGIHHRAAQHPSSQSRSSARRRPRNADGGSATTAADPGSSGSPGSRHAGHAKPSPAIQWPKVYSWETPREISGHVWLPVKDF